MSRAPSREDLQKLAQEFAGDLRPAQTRMTFVDTVVNGKPIPSEDVATWIQMAENQIEKKIREAAKLQRLPHNVLDQTVILVRLTPGTGPPTSLEGVGIELIVASSSRSSTVRENIANVLNAELAGMARDQKFIVSRPIGQVLTPPVPSIPPSRLLPRSRPGRSP
jgi:hypothetical protein